MGLKIHIFLQDFADVFKQTHHETDTRMGFARRFSVMRPSDMGRFWWVFLRSFFFKLLRNPKPYLKHLSKVKGFIKYTYYIYKYYIYI